MRSIIYKKDICICLIGKNENLYIREFVEYYSFLGVGKLIIYDNNDINGEIFENVIDDYIKNTIIFMKKDLINARSFFLIG